MIPRPLLAVVLATALAATARAADDAPPPVLLKDARVLTQDGPPLPRASVLLRDGRIAAVGTDLEVPAGVRVIDCAGRTVAPGLIDGGTRVGLVEIGMVRASNDTDDGSEPSTPDLDVRDGINVESSLFAVTRGHGVTTVLVLPQAGNVVNGRARLLYCTGGTVEEMDAAGAPVGLVITLGSGPTGRFGGKDRAPSTRMGIAALLRREFQRGREHLAAVRRFAEHGDDAEGDDATPPEADPGLEVLAAAVAGDLPVLARAHRLDDIRTALRIAEEFDLRLVLMGATDAWKIAAELAAADVPVIYGPVTLQPDAIDTLGARTDAPALLERAGVRFGLMTDDAHNARNLPYHAGIAASWGLDDPVAPMTRGIADILGVGDRMGRIAEGREATVVVFNGDPVEPLTVVEHIFVRGRAVPLRSRQTELYERWKDR